MHIVYKAHISDTYNHSVHIKANVADLTRKHKETRMLYIDICAMLTTWLHYGQYSYKSDTV